MSDIILILAIWGAVLSSFNFLRKYLDDKIRINVKVNKGIIPGISDDVIIITARNKGIRATIMASYGIVLENGNQVFSENTLLPLELPKKLNSREECSIYLDFQRLKRTIGSEKVKYAFFRDQVGDTYKEKKQIKKIFNSQT